MNPFQALLYNIIIIIQAKYCPIAGHGSSLIGVGYGPPRWLNCNFIYFRRFHLFEKQFFSCCFYFTVKTTGNLIKLPHAYYLLHLLPIMFNEQKDF